jgi:DNA helicase-2/ATP-dependent DNA helicase PcrA
VAQLVPGIGSASARRLLDAMRDAPDPTAALCAFKAPPGAAAAWLEFRAVFVALRGADTAWPADLRLAMQWYLPQLDRLHGDATPRRADLAQLDQLAAASGSRERFLTDLALDPPDATSDESGPPGRDEDYLILSTLHSAKGQEWAAVIVLNVVDGCIPSDMATGDAAQIEEERRLLYVGMTRARRRLSLVVPQRFHVHQQAAWGDRHVYASLTRFIPEALQPLFDRIGAEPPCAAAACEAPEAPAEPCMDIGARVRSLWA